MLTATLLAGLFRPIARLTSASAPGASPLATAAQSALERLTMRVVADPQVQVAKAALWQVWLDSAGQALAGDGGPDADNLCRLSQALEEFAFGCAEKEVNFDPYRPEAFAVIMPPHRWMGITVPGGRYGYDNPDTVYRTIPVSGSSAYVVTGHVSRQRPTDINFTLYVDINVSQPITSLAGNDLVIGPDGSFTVTVSPGQADGAANHIRSTPAAQVLLVRDTLGNWQKQAPASLAVRRVAGPPAPPGRTPSQLATGTAALITNFGETFFPYALQLTARYPVNTLSPLQLPGAQPGTLPTQAQSFGHFSLCDDQALVITVNSGGAAYLTVPVTDDWLITTDYRDHTSSINNAQAVPDHDGNYTFVLSVPDPGIYNWIDPAGLHQGTLFLRWQDLPYPLPPPGPSASATLLPFPRLADFLPSGTPKVTPRQRERQLQARKAGYDRRFASDRWA
jgi:hypothetical protein